MNLTQKYKVTSTFVSVIKNLKHFNLHFIGNLTANVVPLCSIRITTGLILRRKPDITVFKLYNATLRNLESVLHFQAPKALVK